MLYFSQIQYDNLSPVSTTSVHLTRASQILSAQIMSVRHQKGHLQQQHLRTKLEAKLTPLKT